MEFIKDLLDAKKMLRMGIVVLAVLFLVKQFAPEAIKSKVRI